jgi:hypothetical protein
MNTIITLIIVLFIFLSTIKNLKEVNRKSREVKLPPAKPSEARPSAQSSETPSRPVRDWIPTPSDPLPYPAPGWPWKPVPEPIPATGETQRRLPEETLRKLEERYRQLSERPLPEDAVTEEEVFEMKKEEAAPAAKRMTPARAIPKSPRIPALAFNGQAVVNGIIMQEILSPPVGLRRQGGLYW